MEKLTDLQVTQLNKMNRAAQNIALGTILNEGLAGTAEAVSGTSIESSSVVKYSSAPAATSNTAVHAAVTLADGETTTVTTAITNPDVPRILLIKGNAAGITGNVVITGTNFNDEVITDTIAANGSNAVAGTKAFKTVTQFVLPARNAESDSISIGIGVKIGLPYLLGKAGFMLKAVFDGAAESGTTTAGATIEETLYAYAGAPNGAKILDLFFFA